MFVVLVTLDVHPEHRARFLHAIASNARESVMREPGCLRFDVSEDADSPNKYFFYEVYTDRTSSTHTFRRRTTRGTGRR